MVSEHAAPLSRDLVEPPAALVRFLDPCAFDPSPLFEAIQQWIERIDVERELPAGSCVNELAQLVAVTRPRIEQREDQQLGRASFELAIERPRVDT